MNNSNSWVLFGLDSIRFGVEAAKVIELVRAVQLTPLPGTSKLCLGMFNFRGKLIPVVDIRVKLGFSPVRLHPDQTIIIARNNDLEVGFIADEIFQLRGLEDELLESGKKLLQHADMISAVGKAEDGLILLHDLDTLLSTSESQDIQGALQDYLVQSRGSAN